MPQVPVGEAVFFGIWCMDHRRTDNQGRRCTDRNEGVAIASRDHGGFSGQGAASLTRSKQGLHVTIPLWITQSGDLHASKTEAIRLPAKNSCRQHSRQQSVIPSMLYPEYTR